MTRTPHRRHRLGRVRLPDDVPGEVPRRRRPRPDAPPLGLVPRRRDAARARRRGAEHRLQPRAPRRQAPRHGDGGHRRARLRALARPSRASTSRAAHLRRPLHGLVLRLDGPGPEPDRHVLRRRHGARARRCPSATLARAASPRRHRAERLRRRWRNTRRSAASSASLRLRPEPAGGAALGRGHPRRARRRRDPHRERVRVRRHREEDRALGGRGALARARPHRDARRRGLDDRAPGRPAGGARRRDDVPDSARPPPRASGRPDRRGRRVPRRAPRRAPPRAAVGGRGARGKRGGRLRARDARPAAAAATRSPTSSPATARTSASTGLTRVSATLAPR